jgi:hypothetical protein
MRRSGAPLEPDSLHSLLISGMTEYANNPDALETHVLTTVGMYHFISLSFHASL